LKLIDDLTCLAGFNFLLFSVCKGLKL
jgi:hypothetical protein